MSYPVETDEHGNAIPPVKLKTFKIYNEKELIDKCQENAWLKRFGEIFREDPFAELDYEYCFTECKTIEELKKYFLNGNWAIRQGFIYESLAFINQDNGGDEWWTLKKFPDGEIIAFESMTMILIIKDGTHDGLTFEDLIQRLLEASKEQCVKLTYTSREVCNQCGRSVAQGSGLALRDADRERRGNPA